jgi:integrase
MEYLYRLSFGISEISLLILTFIDAYARPRVPDSSNRGTALWRLLSPIGSRISLACQLVKKHFDFEIGYWIRYLQALVHMRDMLSNRREGGVRGEEAA